MVSNRPSSTPKRKPVPTWILLWTAVLLLGAVLFFSNQGWVTGLMKAVGVGQDAQPPVAVQPADNVEVTPTAVDEIAPVISQNGFSADLQPLLDAIAEDQEPQQTATETEEGTRGGPQTASVYFVLAQSDGAIEIVEASRSITAGNSPLTAAIQTLLAGPTAEELSRNMLSLIPEGTRLIGARVSGDTATLDFSDAFQFNTLGIEGYQAQLKQVVFTATAFPTVKKVQFLIEGHRVSSLGEGVPIGVPLDRASFDR